MKPAPKPGLQTVNQDLQRCGVRATFFSSLVNPCTRFVNALVYAAVGVLGAVFAIGGAITAGSLSALLQYANQYTKPFKRYFERDDRTAKRAGLRPAGV